MNSLFPHDNSTKCWFAWDAYRSQGNERNFETENTVDEMSGCLLCKKIASKATDFNLTEFSARKNINIKTLRANR